MGCYCEGQVKTADVEPQEAVILLGSYKEAM